MTDINLIHYSLRRYVAAKIHGGIASIMSFDRDEESQLCRQGTVSCQHSSSAFQGKKYLRVPRSRQSFRYLELGKGLLDLSNLCTKNKVVRGARQGNGKKRRTKPND